MIDLDGETEAQVAEVFEQWWQDRRDFFGFTAEKSEALVIFKAGVRWTLSQAFQRMMTP
jgi:hypothetical protein